MALSLEEANRIAAGALAKAGELGIRINVAVCDSGGRLLEFQGKAIASAAFGRPSGDLTEREAHPTFRAIVAHEGGHMILGQGGVPVIRDGIVEGAVGVGGGTGQEDEVCAQAGAARI